jgi:chemotaxis protein MotB
MAKKKKKSDESSAPDLIQMMTISLFIILLAFFILLNSIAKDNEEKKIRVVGSLVKSFGGEVKNEKVSGLPSEDVFTDGVSPVDFQDLASGDDENAKGLKVKVDKKKTVLSIPDRMLFSRYGTRLKRKGTGTLKKLAKVIKSNAYPVDISGHTDDVPIYEIAGVTNRALSSLRSVNVLKYLVEKQKVSPQRLTAFGWGKERPVVSNKTPATRKINRRIDITFVHDKSLEKPKGFFIFKDFFFNVKDQ